MIKYNWSIYTILGLLGLLLIRDLLPSCPLALFVHALVVAKSAPAATQAARALADAAAASSFFPTLAGQVCVSWRRYSLSPW